MSETLVEQLRRIERTVSRRTEIGLPHANEAEESVRVLAQWRAKNGLVDKALNGETTIPYEFGKMYNIPLGQYKLLGLPIPKEAFDLRLYIPNPISYRDRATKELIEIIGHGDGIEIVDNPVSFGTAAVAFYGFSRLYDKNISRRKFLFDIPGTGILTLCWAFAASAIAAPPAKSGRLRAENENAVYAQAKIEQYRGLMPPK